MCYRRSVLAIQEYVDELGRSRFRRWVNDLDESTRARVLIGIGRLENENLSGVKSVGAGVSELRLNFGPGFRVYFGRDGAKLVLLLGGGTKASQPSDIDHAKEAWKAYKRRKAAGEL